MSKRFTLNVQDGVDTIHREHPWEECNVDDATEPIKVDELTAVRMVASEQARPCLHCKPMEET